MDLQQLFSQFNCSAPNTECRNLEEGGAGIKIANGTMDGEAIDFSVHHFEFFKMLAIPTLSGVSVALDLFR